VKFVFERGKTQVRGEAFHDTWNVENVLDTPRDLAGYVEIKQKFLPASMGPPIWRHPIQRDPPVNWDPGSLGF